MRVALGEVKAVDRSTPLSRSLFKFLIIQTPVQPPPGKVIDRIDVVVRIRSATNRTAAYRGDLAADRDEAP